MPRVQARELYGLYMEIGRVPLKRTFLTDLAIRDTSFITSLKMTAAGVIQWSHHFES